MARVLGYLALLVSAFGVTVRQQEASGALARIPRQAKPGEILQDFQQPECADDWKKNIYTPRLTTFEELDDDQTWPRLKLIKENLTFHRKQWEYVYLMKIIEDLGLPDSAPTDAPKWSRKWALGFAIGQEPTVSYLASRGVAVIATDQPPSQAKTEGWDKSHQYIGQNIEDLNTRQIASTQQMEKLVRLGYLDMNLIDNTNLWRKYRGTFDLVWSICSVEHTGSIEKALTFMKKSLDFLKPGGTAVHTTELNLQSLDKTLDKGITVLLRKRDVDAFHKCVTAMNYEMPKPCYNAGVSTLDKTVDVPPYSHDNHLRMELEGFTTTCVGISVRRKPGAKVVDVDCTDLFAGRSDTPKFL